jgi:hypothetical protein
VVLLVDFRIGQQFLLGDGGPGEKAGRDDEEKEAGEEGHGLDSEAQSVLNDGEV